MLKALPDPAGLEVHTIENIEVSQQGLLGFSNAMNTTSIVLGRKEYEIKTTAAWLDTRQYHFPCDLGEANCCLLSGLFMNVDLIADVISGTWTALGSVIRRD